MVLGLAALVAARQDPEKIAYTEKDLYLRFRPGPGWEIFDLDRRAWVKYPDQGNPLWVLSGYDWEIITPDELTYRLATWTSYQRETR